VTAFTSAFNRHGGNEATILSLGNVFYHWGAVIVPPGYTDPAVYAAGGNPYGTSFATGPAGDGPDAAALDAARYQGRRLAQIALRLRGPAGHVDQGTALTGDYEPSALEWVREHVEQIERTGTTDGVTMDNRPTVLMTYRGAKTGKIRKTPVMRVEHEGSYAAVASKGGEPTSPQWYASLLAEPGIELQDGTVTGVYRAREVSRGREGPLVAPRGGRLPRLCRLSAQDRPSDPGPRARTIGSVVVTGGHIEDTAVTPAGYRIVHPSCGMGSSAAGFGVARLQPRSPGHGECAACRR